VSTVIRKHRQGRLNERSLLKHHPPTSYGGCGPGARPPGLQPPWDKPDFPSAAVITKCLGVTLVFLVILAQTVVLVFFYDMPTKLDDYSRATARMREQRDGMRREARHLESERHLLGREKEELREERERWEKAREDRVPQGAFWGTEPQPAPDCHAYGKREHWAELHNIPEDWTDMDACMNMPTTIKGVFLRRPDRCGYVGGSPHIYGFWMVDWDQSICKPWHKDVADKVSSGQLTWLHLRIHPCSRTLISRVARTGDLAPVVSKLGSWTSTISQSRTGACCARARRSHGITSHITVLHIARHA